MTPKPIPQSLDDLLDHAEDYANFKLRYRGRLPGTLFMLGSKGPAVFLPPTFLDEDARLVCTVHGATASVVVLQASAGTGASGATLDFDQRTSPAPDRREGVALVSEAAGIQQVKFLPILRSASGTFTGFGAPEVLPGSQTQGRFARLLPAQPPTAEEQARAQASLQARGILMAAPETRKPKVRSAPRHGYSC